MITILFAALTVPKVTVMRQFQASSCCPTSLLHDRCNMVAIDNMTLTCHSVETQYNLSPCCGATGSCEVPMHDADFNSSCSTGYGNYGGYGGTRRQLSGVWTPPDVPSWMQRIPRIRSMEGEPLYDRVDAIVALYDEDIQWIYEVNKDLPTTRFYVYDKGNSNKCVQTSLVYCFKLENVGRESNTYLHHIVTQYDNLAEKLVFMQASKPTWGWFPPRTGGHVMQGVDFVHDYLSGFTEPMIHFTWTYFTHNPYREQSLQRADYPVIAPWSAPLPNIQDTHTKNDTIPSQCHTNWFVTSNRTTRFWHTLIPMDSQVDQAMDHIEYWNKYLKSELGRIPKVLAFSNGAVFSAGRSSIRDHPRQFYETLLSSTKLHNNPRSGFYLEMMWPYIVGHTVAAKRCGRHVFYGKTVNVLASTST